MLPNQGSVAHAKTLVKFPDIQIEEDLFVKLPLWGDATEANLKQEPPSERSDALKKWIFRILSTTEDLTNQGLGGGAVRTVSLRRVFGYLCLGSTPSEGFSRIVQGLASMEKGADDSEIKIRSLWEMLFCQKMRPSEVVSEPPAFESFLEGFQVEGEEPVEMVTTEPDALLAMAPVVSALCTHGTLMCRYRITDIFPESGQMAMLYPSTSLSEEPMGLRPSASLASLSAMNEDSKDEF